MQSNLVQADAPNCGFMNGAINALFLASIGLVVVSILCWEHDSTLVRTDSSKIPSQLVARDAGQSRVLFPGRKYPTGLIPIDAFVEDFDGDGRKDIATANFQGSSISILKGNDCGGFEIPISWRRVGFYEPLMEGISTRMAM